MAKFVYPTQDDLRLFVDILQNSKYKIGAYLPAISEDWYVSISEAISYVAETSDYIPCSIHTAGARLLYKVAKMHELTDANKRSSVIAVYLFFLLNDYVVEDPQALKKQAKRIAATKGRRNEDMMIRRIASFLPTFVSLVLVKKTNE